ncbi:formylglycine-generating enzyme family protein [Methylotenera sp.]|uniref:formylglycine-generating enzyme family protein n=1 Tax=Methylotenera sp. TaxID=2051956 RepID=UPI002ED821C6
MSSNKLKLISLLALPAALIYGAAVSAEEMVMIPQGSVTPFFLKKDSVDSNAASKVKVDAFWIDAAPVTNREFQAFVSQHPDWHPTNIKKIFSDAHYLDHWKNTQGADGTASLDTPNPDAPVVNVSWFAAASYCEAQDKRLPSTDEWEYTLNDNERDKENLQKQIISWYSVPNRAPLAVKGQPANGFGVFDLAGLIWEWTADFNSYMAPPDSRNSGDKTQFCGSGSLSASNLDDYAAFMRYSYRESLKGSFTGKNLGFRCAKDAK